MRSTTYKNSEEALRETWRSLVVTRALAEGLAKVILRTGSDTQKAMLRVILDNAEQAQDDWAFDIELPRELKHFPKQTVEGLTERPCLRCNELVMLPRHNRLCTRCRADHSVMDIPTHTLK